MTLADRLQHLLAAKGFAIREVAELAGMDPQVAWRIVSGKVKDPRLSSVRKIVEAAGSTLGEFFADEDD